MFFKVIPSVLGRLVNFNITSRFILGRPVFPDYLSVFYDYILRKKQWTQMKTKKLKQDILNQ